MSQMSKSGRYKRLLHRTDNVTVQSLLSTIGNGWPESKKDVQNDLLPYFDVRDTLSHQNGIIIKGERIVIQASLRDTTKKQLHSAHLESRQYDKTSPRHNILAGNGNRSTIASRELRGSPAIQLTTKPEKLSH